MKMGGNEIISLKTNLALIDDVKLECSGRFKYILMKISDGSNSKYVVRSYESIDIQAEVYERERRFISNLGIQTECVGGGRIDHDAKKKMILVYGYSMGYGRADHSIAVALLKKKFPHYVKISYTNEGY